MKKIQILMSTYNGARYLAEQLDSILEQDCERIGLAVWKLLIRDDGSEDGTQEILKEYAGKYPEKIQWIQGENCGVIQSFFKLLQAAEEDMDYYALADQDDYWMPEKLSCGIGALEGVTDGIPKLYCCRPKLVDAALQELPIEIRRPPVRQSFENALLENVVTGCTVVMNKSLRDIVIVRLPEFTMMHDRWLYLTAACFGTVLYDETPHICYRQHGGNVVGTNSNRLAEFKERLSHFHKKKHDITRQTAEFLRVYGDLSGEELQEYRGNKKVAEYLKLAKELVKGRKSFWTRIWLVASRKLYRQRKGDNLVFQLLLLLGIY